MKDVTKMKANIELGSTLKNKEGIMQSLMIIYFGIVGLILGSFYIVVGLRVPLKESVVKPRSSCSNCNNALSPVELIPVLSYLMQRGKCRSCKATISPIYPFMELITGVLFAVSPFIVGWGTELLICYTLISLLVIITVSDLAYMIIPDKILIIFASIFIVLQFTVGDRQWLDILLGAIIGFGFLLLIAVVTNGGMGGGDIKLFGLLGFILGVKLVILAFFFSVVYGAVIGMLMMLLRVLKQRQPVPFGPFIAVGALTAYYFGEKIVQWYFGVLM